MLYEVGQRLLRHRLALIGLAIVILLLALAIFAPFIAPHPPNEQDLLNRFGPPSLEHPFGTDSYGRDIFSRVIHGTRISFYIGSVAVGISSIIGITLGALGGY
ncbi:MAG: ABC transporter permease, partial [Candidatus Bipolaricaulota bacterium]